MKSEIKIKITLNYEIALHCNYILNKIIDIK